MFHSYCISVLKKLEALHSHEAVYVSFSNYIFYTVA